MDDTETRLPSPPSTSTRPATPPLPNVPLADLFSPNSPPSSRPRTPPLPGRSRSGSAGVKREDGDAYLKREHGGEGPEGDFHHQHRARSRSGSDGYGSDTKPGESSRYGYDGYAKKSTSPPIPAGPTLIPDLPLAWDEAGATFESLERCVYERKDLGLSREQDEMMVCDCVYDADDPIGSACGAESDCINRAIFIECLANECRAGKHCRNQRLAKKQYAAVDVVQTEMKGFGLRAREDIPAGALIYEYIGEVVVEKTFRKRMAQYADEGIKHFYFMMLQKEEYLDATKKGGIGRFANHSCNPNCEVQKWVVGRRLRMGIFTKRDVLKDEEITFNYNVDRYGHEAQTCYCGEPNCVGTIGGKTQTDIGGIDDLFLDALGIMDEVKQGGMKGTRKKAARQLAENDYDPVLHPIQEHQATKVAAAIRQSMENPRMMGLLLKRVKMSEDPVVQRQLMRMHGFSLMTMILTDLSQDRNIVLLALEGLINWKLTIRNKIEDSNIEDTIKTLRDGPDEELSALAKQLLQYWSTLEMSYKIPRVNKIASLDDDDARDTTTIAEQDAIPRRHVRMDELANTDMIQIDLAPIRRGPPPPPVRHRPPPPPMPRPVQQTPSSDRVKLNAIIAMAQQAQVAAPVTPPVVAASSSRPEASEPRKRQKTSHRSTTAEDEAKKEKRLTKLVGEVVVRSMSKYKDQMEHETFKRYAKECTALLVDKEKRGHTYAAHRHPSLSDEKKAKIKAFTKDYAHKLLRNLKAKGKLKKVVPGSSDVNGSHLQVSSPLATPAVTPGASSLTPGTTPGGTMNTTPTALHGTPNGGAALLDDIFGADDPDDDDDGDMDVDIDIDDVGTPNAATPSASASGADHTPAPTTPPLPASPANAPKAIVLDHASGPFISSKSGPILVDRVQNLRVDQRKE